MQSIMETAVASKEDVATVDFAHRLDAADTLSSFRTQYNFPVTEASAKIRTPGSSCIYLCGNSLGLQPKKAKEYVVEELDKWAELGVEGHFKTERPWMTVDETVRDASARLVGAQAHEVVVMNSLTVNLHLLMAGFYRPNAPPAKTAWTPTAAAATDSSSSSSTGHGRRRHKIMIEDHAFPSDTYAVKSQLLLHGCSVEDSLVLVKPREGEELIRTEDVLALIAQHGEELALVMLPGVQYYTGQVFDMKTITDAAHAVGSYCGWDLAHAAGNVPLHLHDWNADFAAWCGYKYLNSGPGGLSGAFLHDRYSSESLEERPHFAGWWGHRKSDRFKMGGDFVPSTGISGWQLSNPPVLPMASLRASLELFDAAGMEALRSKSLALTGYLELLLTQLLPTEVDILTPKDTRFRGCQLSLSFKLNVREVYKRLGDEGIIVDIREPHVMRVAPTPLYNCASDVHQFVTILAKVVAEIRAAS